jgi:hypothetical protein
MGSHSLMRAWALLLLSSCGRLAFDPASVGGSDGVSDAEVLGTGPFGGFRLIAELDSAFDEDDPAVSSDGLELFWASKRTGVSKIWSARRASRTDPWGAAQQVMELSVSTDDKAPELSSDDLTIAFVVNGNIAMSTRASRTATWSPPVVVLDVGSVSAGTPALCNEDLRMYLRVEDGLAIDHLHVTDRATTASPWPQPTPVMELNSATQDTGPWMSADCNRMYFDSDRMQNGDIFVAYRNAANDMFGPPSLLAEIRSAFGSAHDVSLTADEKYIVWSHQTIINKLYEGTR